MADMKFYPAGDAAMVVEFGRIIDETTNNKVLFLQKLLEEAQIAGINELLPAFCSLMIFYTPSEITYEELKHHILAINGKQNAAKETRKCILEVPCCYGGSFGPDLEDMESLTGLTKEEIIKIHSATDYKIFMLGFLPGFVYLGGLDRRIEVPRLSSPRLKIEPGSVGIGGNQTGVYPIASPGGWRLIGKTPLEFYQPMRKNPILCNAGEYIRFIPISPAEYEGLKKQIMEGSCKPHYYISEHAVL